MAQSTKVEFYLSPSCPWAWRTALWIRQVSEQVPLEIDWKLFSLAIVNRGHDYAADSHSYGYQAEILLIAARQFGGNDSVESLYMALGDALHGRKEERTDALLTGALTTAGLPVSLLAESRSDKSYEEKLISEHETAANVLGAFGVPTIRFPDSDIAFFGPVIDPVPTGAEAVELWDHFKWSLTKPYLYEVKRERKHRAGPLGLSDVNETVAPVRASGQTVTA
jgi:2-hydroxychromene-2-carboxylate isomerase